MKNYPIFKYRVEIFQDNVWSKFCSYKVIRDALKKGEAIHYRKGINVRVIYKGVIIAQWI